MSLEGQIHKSEKEHLEAPAPGAVLREESIAPVQGVSDEGESINQVRARLGLSRREALGALAGAMVMPGEVVEAQERAGARLERSASYEEGLSFLRERARTQNSEDLYYFSRNERSTAWVRVQGTTNEVPGGASGVTFAPEDRRYLYRLRRLVEGGERVEMLHTHPTRVLSGVMSGVDQRLLAGVPPSPTDLINMFGAEQGLTADARERLTFSVVSENGTWTYATEQHSPMMEIIDAGASHFEQLSGPPAVNARHAAEDIRDVMEPMVRNVPNGRGLLRGLARSIEDGSFVENLRLAPTELAMKRWMLEAVVADPQTSRQGRQYIETILMAADAINQASQVHDPDGYTIEQMMDTVPQVSDAEGGFSEYQDFWRRRGVSLSYRPF